MNDLPEKSSQAKKSRHHQSGIDNLNWISALDEKKNLTKDQSTQKIFLRLFFSTGEEKATCKFKLPEQAPSENFENALCVSECRQSTLLNPKRLKETLLWAD